MGMIPTRASAPSKSTRSSWILRDLAGVCRSTSTTHRPTTYRRRRGRTDPKPCTCMSSVTTLPFDVGNRVANVLAELTQDAADEITVLAGSAASLTNSVAPDRVKVVIRELLTGWGDDAKNGV